MKQGGVQFNMPEGAVHYYRKHNVQPSAKFQAFVRDYNVRAAKAAHAKKEAQRKIEVKSSKNSYVQFALSASGAVDPIRAQQAHEYERTRFFRD